MTRPPGNSGDLTSPAGSREEPEVEDAFDRIVDEGRDRLRRPLLPLLSTGFLGGVDVGVGVLIYLVVETKTDQPLLAALAFTIGFVALLMARSELFTENFLVPVTAVVAKAGSVLELLRLWVVTLLANLAAGFVMALLTVTALPEVRETAVSTASHYAQLGVNWRSFCLAVLAGAVITLLTRMQHASDQLGVKIVPAVLLSFVLVGRATVPLGAGLDPDVRGAAQRRGAVRIRRLAGGAGLVRARQPRRRTRARHLGAPAESAAPSERVASDTLTAAGSRKAGRPPCNGRHTRRARIELYGCPRGGASLEHCDDLPGAVVDPAGGCGVLCLVPPRPRDASAGVRSSGLSAVVRTACQVTAAVRSVRRVPGERRRSLFGSTRPTSDRRAQHRIAGSACGRPRRRHFEACARGA